MRTKQRAGVAAAAAVLLLIAVLFHHAVAKFAVSQIIGLTTGYRVQIGEMRLGRDHGAFFDAHISKRGDPVLDAQRIDLYYSLRDLLPGSRHRFGLVGITIDRPQLTLIHHRDGTYNLVTPGGGAPGPAGRANAVPLRFYARIRDGEGSLIDEFSYYKEARLQRVHNLVANVSVDTSARTSYVVRGAIEGATDQPFQARGAVDYTRGYALHHIQARAIPIVTIGNYLINSPAARILSGTARNFDAKIYALDIAPNQPFTYHIGASTDLANTLLFVNGIVKPIANLSGRVEIVDDGFIARHLNATLNGIPMDVAGGIYDFADPQFRLGLTGVGDLQQLRGVLAFARAQPASGIARVNGLIEGPIGKPLLLFGLNANRASYGTIPLQNARAIVSIYNGDVGIVPLQATYAGIDVNVRGHITMGADSQTELAINYAAPSSRIPYVSAVLPDQPVSGEALLDGPNKALAARGFVASVVNPEDFSSFFNMTGQGAGTVGPLVARGAGGTIAGAYHLDRPHGTSAFWVSAQNLALRQIHPTGFPGLNLPSLPAFSGVISDANLAGTGSGRDVVLAGRVVATGTTVAGVRFDSIGAAFAGNLGNVAVQTVDASGPWGRFEGRGSYAPGEMVAKGQYAGSLEGLRQFTGPLGGTGPVAGPIAFALAGRSVVIQTEGLSMQGASVRGIPVRSVAGTVAMENGMLRVYSAHAVAAGGDLVAAGTFASRNQTPGNLALAATGMDGAQMRGLGLPLQSGNVDAIGTVTAGGRQPSFQGGVVVRNGRAQNYPVNGSADVTLLAGTLHVARAVAGVGDTYGVANGSIAGIGGGLPSYGINADVPAGDIATAARTFHIDRHMAEGSFAAQLAIAGSGSSPSITGPVWVPVGDVNGLGFLNGSAAIAADRHGVSARGGRALVGSTATRFEGSVRGASQSVAVKAPQARLSDFNDFFDTGDTLAGSGSLALAYRRSPGAIVTSGDVDIAGLRYRRLPIGDTDASWSSLDNLARGFIHVGGPQGRLRATGSVALAPAASLGGTVAGSRYDLSASLQRVDLSTWLPALGFPTVPVTGRIDGSARVLGKYPHLGVSGAFALNSGTVGPVQILRASVVARNAGSRIAITQADLALPALVATGSGSFGLAKRDPIAFSMHAQTDDPAKLAAELTKRTLPISGMAETTVTIGGTFAAPTYRAGVSATNASIYGMAVPSLFGSLALTGRKLELRNAEVQLGKGSASLAGALPLILNPLSIGPASAPIALDVTAHRIELGAFSGLLGNKTVLGGTVDGHVGLSGTARDPRIYGSLGLTNGSYRSDVERQPISGTVAAVVFGGATATLQRLHAQMGRGTLDASGTVGYAGGFSNGPLGYDLTGVARGAQLDFPTFGSGTLDARLKLARTAQQPLAVLSGTALVTDATVPFSAFARGGGATPDGAAPAPPLNLAFNLDVTAGNNVRVRSGGIGAGLDISGMGHALLAGTAAHPTLAGSFNSTGGTLTYIDHAFKVQEGSVTFDPANGVVPEIYAVGVTHVTNPDPNAARNPTGSTDISVKVTGLLTNPQLDFTSDPPGYSRDQIIALLVPFGGFVNGIQFSSTGDVLPAGQLAGAPVPQTGAPLPNIFVQRQNGSLTVGQEAFNILNAQFAQGLLAPLENALGHGLGLSDVNLTVDYTGNVGFNFRKILAKKFYAIYATTLGYPLRQTVGFEYQPTPFTAAQFTYFVQQGLTPIVGSSHQTVTNLRATSGQAVSGSSGFTFTFQRLF